MCQKATVYIYIYTQEETRISFYSGGPSSDVAKERAFFII